MQTFSTYEFFYDTSFDDYDSIKIISVDVSVGTPQLNVVWAPEAIDALRNAHGIIDAEAELTAAMITAEINADIVRELMQIR